MKVIKAGLLIDGTGNPPIPEGVVLIQGSEIIDVGPASRVEIPTDCEVVDCTNETVLPGLIDSHSHIMFCGANRRQDKPPSIVDQEKVPLPTKAILAYRNILDDMSSGVVTIRSLGADNDLDIHLRDATARGDLPGPRILASGQPLRSTHGTAEFLGKPADGKEEVRKAVRDRISRGADVIKVFATNIQAGRGQVAYRHGDLTTVPAYTKEELSAAVEEAHNAGRKVAAHAIGGPALRWAMEAGVDSVEHANLMEEQDIEVFLNTGCVLSDPNYYLFFDKEYGFESRPAWDQLPGWWQEKVAYAGEKTRTVHRKAFEAGVRFVLALDSGHGLIWREAKCMVEILGASTMDAILSLTKHSAELCGLTRVGTLQPGKLADLISVEGNPLESISALRDIRLIMKEGRRYEGILRKYQDLEISMEEFANASARDGGSYQKGL